MGNPASVEFFSYVDEEHLDISHGDTDFHTVVTVFSPDTSRNNSEYDYYQELVSKDGNYDVPIKRRRTDVGNTGTILSESYKGTPSRDIIASAAQNRNSESEESYAPDPGIVKESRVSIENQIAEYEDYQTPGIHINDKGTRFTDLIFADDKDKRKTIETRWSYEDDGLTAMDAFIGKRVAVIRTGRGKARIVGYVTIAGKKIYEDAQEFNDDYAAHKVPADDAKYGWTDDHSGKKVGYILEQPEKLSEPILIGSEGYHKGRYSARDVSFAANQERTGRHSTVTKSQAQLARENKELRERLAYWKGQTKLTETATANKSDVQKAARELLKEYGSKADKVQVRDALQKLADYIVSDNNGYGIDNADLTEMANEIAETIMSEVSVRDDDVQETLERLTDYVRGKVFPVSSELEFGGKEDFRAEAKRVRKAYGMGLTTDAKKANTKESDWYGELEGDFEQGQTGIAAGTIEYGSNPDDMVHQIIERLDRLTDSESNPFQYKWKENVTDLSNRMLKIQVEFQAAEEQNHSAFRWKKNGWQRLTTGLVTSIASLMVSVFRLTRLSRLMVRKSNFQQTPKHRLILFTTAAAHSQLFYPAIESQRTCRFSVPTKFVDFT